MKLENQICVLHDLSNTPKNNSIYYLAQPQRQDLELFLFMIRHWTKANYNVNVQHPLAHQIKQKLAINIWKNQHQPIQK